MLTVLTHSHFLFIFRLKYLLESNNIKLYTIPYRSTQHNTTQNWKGTGTYTYTDCYSILTYPALHCNLAVLM